MQYGSAMMKRNAIFAFLALATAFVCIAEDDNSDEKIKRLIVGSNFYIDNPDASYRMFMNARRRCGTDTNRFARLLAEVAQTNNDWVAQDAISSLGVYGTSAQLPFLYSMATNEQHGATAVKSILRLEGVTSNSLAVAGRCLSNKAIKEPERLDVCRTIVHLAFAVTTPTNDQVRALSYVHCHARTCDYPAGLDQSLLRCDPSYRQSRRRLSIMRDVYLHGVDQWDIAYVTNAINELVAYPEADLPE